MKRSDAYLLQAGGDRGHGGKHKKAAKKGKKSKRRTANGGGDDDDDDDDSGGEPLPLHHVSTFAEMPEGASLSDNDDANPADADDPHRALDINLDM